MQKGTSIASASQRDSEIPRNLRRSLDFCEAIRRKIALRDGQRGHEDTAVIPDDTQRLGVAEVAVLDAGDACLRRQAHALGRAGVCGHGTLCAVRFDDQRAQLLEGIGHELGVPVGGRELRGAAHGREAHGTPAIVGVDFNDVGAGGDAATHGFADLIGAVGGVGEGGEARAAEEVLGAGFVGAGGGDGVGGYEEARAGGDATVDGVTHVGVCGLQAFGAEVAFES